MTSRQEDAVRSGIPPPAGSAGDDRREHELLLAIANYLQSEGYFGIDPRVFPILDSLESSRAQIASIEEMVDKMISVRLRNIADSVYHGMMRRGRTRNFTDVITSLGMRPAKILIVTMALFSRLGLEHVRLEMESFAISLFARLIAEQMGFDQSSRENAELGGLFVNLGKVVIAAYQSRFGTPIEPAFVDKYHLHFASEIISTFGLPAYLWELIQERNLALTKRGFSVAGVVFLARSAVEKMLGETGTIEIKAPMPIIADNLEVTLGSIISEHFALIGLGKFVKVVPV